LMCSVQSRGSRFELRSPFFLYLLDTSSGLRAESWTNLISGRSVNLGDGPELEVDVDTADQRIWITGWRVVRSDEGGVEHDHDADLGVSTGFAEPGFDDGDWKGTMTPAIEGAHSDPTAGEKIWLARTHVFLPPWARDRRITLHLGGFGLFDYSYMRIFLNGRWVADRHAPRRWADPAVIDVGKGSHIRSLLRFGQDNVIAIQATGYHTRTKLLDELDASRARHLPMKCQWPGQFEQFIVIGEPSCTPRLDVTGVEERCGPDGGCIVFTLSSPGTGLVAEVTYRWDPQEPVLRRFTTLRNEGDR